MPPLVTQFITSSKLMEKIINYYYNCKITGIEMNNNYFDICINNKKNYLKNYNKEKNKIEFLNIFAEKYKIKFIIKITIHKISKKFL